MHDAGDSVDVTTVANRLRHAGDLEALGGAAYLADILQAVPVIGHVTFYARIVAEKSTFRRIIRAGIDLVQKGYSETGAPGEVVSAAEQTLRDAWTGEHHRAPKAVKDALPGLLAEIDAIKAGERQAGLMTGLQTLDTSLGGLFRGEAFIVSARPGIGKTALGCQVAHHFATHDRGVLFVSLEMSARQLLLRVLCSQASVSSKRVRIGAITQGETDRLVEASYGLQTAPWWILDAPQTTTGEIRRTARRLARDGLALIVVDYLQRLNPADRRANRYEQVGQMSADLKSLALELDVPVLCLVQSSRASDKDDRPSLSHLRESGNIEADADVVAFLRRTEGERTDPGESIGAELRILKNRNGETGTVALEWLPSRTMFRCGGEW
jgi:replicative DNA helicase